MAKAPAPVTNTRVAVTAGGGGAFPALSSTITTAPPNIFSQLWQIGGGFAQSILGVTVPALGAGASAQVTQMVPLTNVNSGIVFPPTFTLADGQQAIFHVSAALSYSGVPPTLPILSTPYVLLSLAQQSGFAATSSLLSVQGPGTFNTPIATVYFTAYSPSATSAISVNLAVTALLVGIAGAF